MKLGQKVDLCVIFLGGSHVCKLTLTYKGEYFIIIVLTF